MLEQEIYTINDFDQNADFEYQISPDEKYLRRNKIPIEFYEKDQNSSRLKYQVITPDKVPQNINCLNAIAMMCNNTRVQLYDILRHNVSTNNRQIIPPFNEEITTAIREGEAFAASDASMAKGEMTGYWCIKDRDKKTLADNLLYHKEWMENTAKGAETITLLELIEVLGRKGKHITSRKIEIGFDNRNSYKKITQALLKPSEYTQDSGAAIARIKTIIKEVSFNIELVLAKDHVAPRQPY